MTDTPNESKLDPFSAFLWRHRAKQPIIAVALCIAGLLAVVAFKLAS